MIKNLNYKIKKIYRKIITSDLLWFFDDECSIKIFINQIKSSQNSSYFPGCQNVFDAIKTNYKKSLNDFFILVNIQQKHNGTIPLTPHPITRTKYIKTKINYKLVQVAYLRIMVNDFYHNVCIGRWNTENKRYTIANKLLIKILKSFMYFSFIILIILSYYNINSDPIFLIIYGPLVALFLNCIKNIWK